MLKHLTFSADEKLVARARTEHASLTSVFRHWLAEYAGETNREQRFDEIMKRLSHIRVGRRFSRDEDQYRAPTIENLGSRELLH